MKKIYFTPTTQVYHFESESPSFLTSSEELAPGVARLDSDYSKLGDLNTQNVQTSSFNLLDTSNNEMEIDPFNLEY